MTLLGIEIGGTKLQLGVGQADGGVLTELQRREIDAAAGADAIRRSILEAAADLIDRHAPTALGIGFGGPVTAGRTITSHQVDGWDDFPLADWAAKHLGLPTVVGNDCDVAALAEATWGAGAGSHIVLYVTVGTGVGGGLVIGGQLHGQGRPAAAEIGHLRPGLQAQRPEQTVESLASGWGIAAEAAARIRGDLARPVHGLGDPPADAAARRQQLQVSQQVQQEYADDLLGRCGGDLDQLTAVHVADAAGEGNQLAADSLQQAITTLGWAIAQAVTLTSAERIVVGGGVSLLGEARFFQPLRTEADRYVFPPLAGHYQIVPAQLGEQVVVHGAIALASQAG